ncbi:MAG: tRNA lysidine(34) synthetase TilS [Maricaulaceae bacterium]
MSETCPVAHVTGMLDAHVPQTARTLAIGFSGGGDSTALLHLAHDWARRRARELVVLTVDHRFQTGSAGRAHAAAARAQALNRTAVVLTAPAVPRNEAQARSLRHRLLADAARSASADAVLLGHTWEDQAETLWMRLSAGTGPRGLAGMRVCAPSPVWPEGRGLTLVRPLLGIRRAALRAWLRARGVDWDEDPMNQDQAFARVRARALSERWPALFDRLAALAPAAQRLDDAERAAAADCAAGAGQWTQEGGFVLNRAQYGRAPEAVRLRALEAIALAVSGASAPAPGAKLTALDRALQTADFAGATLGGARFFADGRVERDPGAVTGRADGTPGVDGLRLAPGRVTVWDGRVEMVAPAPGWRVRPHAHTPDLVRGGVACPLTQAAEFGIEARWLGPQRLKSWLAPRGLTPLRPLGENVPLA